MSDWWEREFDEIADDYSIEPDGTSVNDILFGGELDVDSHAQGLFMDAMFGDDPVAYEQLVDYMWDVYGIDFEDAFSWEDFREWYG